MDYQHGSGSGDKFAAYPQQPYSGQPYSGQQPYSNQAYPFPAPTVITVQPNAPLSPPENEYLCYSVFTMLCCFAPLGIAAMIHSLIVSKANTRGDRVEAARASRLARIMNHTALGIGIPLIVGGIIAVIVIFTSIY